MTTAVATISAGDIATLDGNSAPFLSIFRPTNGQALSIATTTMFFVAFAVDPDRWRPQRRRCQLFPATGASHPVGLVSPRSRPSTHIHVLQPKSIRVRLLACVRVCVYQSKPAQPAQPAQPTQPTSLFDPDRVNSVDPIRLNELNHFSSFSTCFRPFSIIRELLP